MPRYNVEIENGQKVLKDYSSPSSFISSNIRYDNTSSGLSSTNVQDAIDEALSENETAISSAAAWMVYENNKSPVRKYFVVSTNSADKWTYRGRGTTGRGNTDKVVVFVSAGLKYSQYGFTICAIGLSESAVNWSNPTSYGSATITSHKTKRGNTLYMGRNNGSWQGDANMTIYGSSTIDGSTYELIPVPMPTTTGNLATGADESALFRVAEDILVYDMAYTHLQQAQVTPSHIGQIIESTTLDAPDKVQAIYGTNTTWIQHSGYVLRGATSGVVAKSATKDGGSDTHTPSGTVTKPTFTGTQTLLNHTGGAVSNTTLTSTAQIPAHTHGSKTLTGSTKPLYWESQQGKTSGIISSSSDGNKDRTASSGDNFGSTTLTINATHEHNSVGGTTAHGHGFTQPTAHTYTPEGSVSQPTFTGASQDTRDSFKNVYIWERIA